MLISFQGSLGFHLMHSSALPFHSLFDSSAILKTLFFLSSFTSNFQSVSHTLIAFNRFTAILRPPLHAKVHYWTIMGELVLQAFMGEP